jgi:hypothetical protein
MAFGDGNIMNTILNTKVYLYTGFSSTIQSSFTSSGNFSYGITADGTPDTYLALAFQNKILKMSGFSSTVSSSVSYTAQTYGITWDGTNLCSSNDSTDSIKQHSGFTSTISDSFSSPTANQRGISIQDGNIRACTQSGGEKAYLFDGFSSTIDDSFALTNVSGITQDGSSVYTLYGSTKMGEMDGFSSTFLNSFSAAFSASDSMIEWDDFTGRNTGGGGGATFIPNIMSF